ncbi:MAG: hypothetical protein R2865_14055 [Deinococcales bacterium]
MHADALSNIPELFEIKAVMELDERGAEARNRFNCQSFTDFDDLLASEVELIVIATLASFMLNRRYKL